MSETSVSPVLRVICAVRVIGRGFSRLASIDAAWRSKPSARAIGAPGARPARAAAAPTRTSAMRRRKWRTLRPEAKRAAPSVGQRVVGARDVVAERGAGVRRRRTGSRRCARAARAPRPPRPPAAGARARAPRRTRARRRCPSAWIADAVLQRVEQRGVVADRHDERALARARPGRARSSASALGVGARRTRSRVRSLGPAKPSMPDDARTPAAWPPARRGCRGRRSRRPAGSTRSRSASAAIACAPPIAVDLVGAAQRRGGEDHRVRRRRDDDLVDARPRARSPRPSRPTTGTGARPPGAYTAARRTGTSRSAHGLALRRASTARLVVQPGLGDRARRWPIASLSARTRRRASSALPAPPSQRASRRTAQRPASRRRRSARSYSRSASSPPLAHVLDDLRDHVGDRRRRRGTARADLARRPRRRPRPCSHAASRIRSSSVVDLGAP